MGDEDATAASDWVCLAVECGCGINVAWESTPSSLRFPASEKSGVDLIPVSTPERLGVGTPGMLKPEVEMIDRMMSRPLGGVEDAEADDDGEGDGGTADGFPSLAALCVIRETTPPDLSPGRAICSRPPARLASEVVGVVWTTPPPPPLLNILVGGGASATLILFGGEGCGGGALVAAAAAEDDFGWHVNFLWCSRSAARNVDSHNVQRTRATSGRGCCRAAGAVTVVAGGDLWMGTAFKDAAPALGSA